MSEAAAIRAFVRWCADRQRAYEADRRRWRTLHPDASVSQLEAIHGVRPGQGGRLSIEQLKESGGG